MSATVAARDDLRGYTGKKWPSLNLKGQLTKLLREIAHATTHPLKDWTERRVRSVFNGEDHVNLRQTERDQLDELIEEAKHEHRDLAQLAASLQALLFGPEADFYRPQVDAIRAGLFPQGSGASRGSADYGPGDRDRSFAATAEDGEA